MRILFIFLILGLFQSSCSKSETSESRFTWVYEGTSFSAKQQYAKLSGIAAPSIRAGIQEGGDAGSGPRIHLASLNPGIFTIASGTVTYFDYIDTSGFIHAGSSGSVTITNNKNNLLSGNFSVTLSNNKTLSGDFINTPIKP